jgi:hypothetical protein
MEQRFSGLQKLLRGYAELVHTIRTKHPDLTQLHPYLLFALLTPWFFDPRKESKDQVELAKRRAAEMGFDGERISVELREVLSKDKHLAECCGEPNVLAYFLDEEFVRTAADLLSEGATDSLDELFISFGRKVYEQGPFSRVLYSHIFNLDSPLARIDLGTVLLEKLSSSEISTLLGEPTLPLAQSFLQPPNVGSFFLVQEETGAVTSEANWFLDKHFAAINLIRIFQYSMGGVVHVDYSAPFYKPVWVNHLRRFGLFYFGNPRRLAYSEGKEPFVVKQEHLPLLRRFLDAYTSPTILKIMKDESSAFRQASLRAGDYYEASLTYERPVERLIALSIAVEALFSPGDSHEYSFRIAQTASQLIGSTAEDKRAIYDDLRALYNRRSELMHGTYKVRQVYDGSYVTHDEIDKWSTIIRKGVLRFLTLFLRGRRTKDDLMNVRNELLMSALDPAAAAEIQRQSDVLPLIEEFEKGLFPAQ